MPSPNNSELDPNHNSVETPDKAMHALLVEAKSFFDGAFSIPGVDVAEIAETAETRREDPWPRFLPRFDFLMTLVDKVAARVSTSTPGQSSTSQDEKKMDMQLANEIMTLRVTRCDHNSKKVLLAKIAERVTACRESLEAAAQSATATDSAAAATAPAAESDVSAALFPITTSFLDEEAIDKTFRDNYHEARKENFNMPVLFAGGIWLAGIAGSIAAAFLLATPLGWGAAGVALLILVASAVMGLFAFGKACSYEKIKLSALAEEKTVEEWKNNKQNLPAKQLANAAIAKLEGVLKAPNANTPEADAAMQQNADPKITHTTSPLIASNMQLPPSASKAATRTSPPAVAATDPNTLGSGVRGNSPRR